MNTPDAIPTGGPFIYQITGDQTSVKQPVIRFLECGFGKQELRYHQWLSELPEREKDRRWVLIYESRKQQLDNERSGSILSA